MKYFHELFDQCVDADPTKVFLYTKEETLSYQQIDHSVGKLTKEINFFNLPAKSRIVVVGENCADYIATVLAVSRANAVFCGFNARQTAFELDQYIQKFDPHLIIFVENGSTACQQLATTFQAEPSVLPNFKILRRDSTKEPLPDDIASIIFSSGTTGEIKGIMLTHRSMILGAQSTVQTRGFVSSDRLYACIPMVHAFGLTSILCGALLVGASIIIRSKFDPSDVVDCLENLELSVLQGPPVMFSKLLDWMNQHKPQVNASHLRYMYTGSAPLISVLKNNVEQRFNKTLHHGYGMSEYGASVTVTDVNEHRTDSTAGYPCIDVELKITSNGKQCKPNEIGNLFVRGPSMMAGYLDAPELTAKVLDKDGWLNTGDIGYIDQQGALFIVAREKEVIKHSGFSVYPAEIENLLNSHAGVDSSAVIGKPDEIGNEQILAFVKMNPGAVFDEEQLRTYLRKNLSSYKQPSVIKQILEFPLTVSNKIIKRKILENDTVC